MDRYTTSTGLTDRQTDVIGTKLYNVNYGVTTVFMSYYNFTTTRNDISVTPMIIY